MITAIGNIPEVVPGQTVKISGEWVKNRKYGDQSQIKSYNLINPNTAETIEKYLGSGFINGIGPVVAKAIVETFGTESFNIIENYPERLSEVNGIGSKKTETIKKAWTDQKEVREIMVFLQDHNVNLSLAVKIHKKYGNKSIEIVKNNPYQLAADIHGIGFLTADKIARSLNIDLDSPLRIKEGTIYVLNEITNEGHVCSPYELLLQKASQMLGVPKEKVINALTSLSEEKRIVIENLFDRVVYLKPFYVAEKSLSQGLLKLKLSNNNCAMNIERILNQTEKTLKIKLAEEQKKAVISSVKNKTVIITGGPGTGKTTIVKAITKIYDSLNKKVVLAAPTGRAAKKLQEATGREAKTIHRLLEFNPQTGRFQRNQEDPLDADAVVIDEMSMTDTILIHHLIKAIPAEASLIMVGDVDQLPSVGPGNVLNDLIASGGFDVVTLNEIFRQAQESKIITNAHLVNQGKFPSLKNDGKDFYFINQDDPEKIPDLIVKLVAYNIPKSFGYKPLDIQVLAPMHKGTSGVKSLNEKLQDVLNKNPEIYIGAKKLKIGDKVMQTVNNYNKEVFNGDIGIVRTIDKENQEIKIDYDGREVIYDYPEADEFTLAYAVSVHKSQGSEYPAVVMPILTQHYVMLQRNLLYTGITRAKKLAVLVGSPKAMTIAVKNNKAVTRCTGLKEMLQRILSTTPPV